VDISMETKLERLAVPLELIWELDFLVYLFFSLLWHCLQSVDLSQEVWAILALTLDLDLEH